MVISIHEAMVTEATMFLPEYLKVTTGLLDAHPVPGGFVYRGRDSFIKDNGQQFPVAADQALPGKFHAWPQQCFDNAYRLARRWKARFRYVEGVALGVIPIHHAWVINAAGEVLDPTWLQNSTIGTEYFGVVIPLDIAKQVRHKDNASIIDNWQRRWPLFREPWPVVLQRNRVGRYSR